MFDSGRWDGRFNAWFNVPVFSQKKSVICCVQWINEKEVRFHHRFYLSQSLSQLSEKQTSHLSRLSLFRKPAYSLSLTRSLPFYSWCSAPAKTSSFFLLPFYHGNVYSDLVFAFQALCKLGNPTRDNRIKRSVLWMIVTFVAFSLSLFDQMYFSCSRAESAWDTLPIIWLCKNSFVYFFTFMTRIS